MIDINKEKYIEQFKKHLDNYESVLNARLEDIAKTIFGLPLEEIACDEGDSILIDWNDPSYEDGSETADELEYILDGNKNKFINYSRTEFQNEDVWNFRFRIYKCPFDILTTYSLDKEE